VCEIREYLLQYAARHHSDLFLAPVLQSCVPGIPQDSCPCSTIAEVGDMLNAMLYDWRQDEQYHRQALQLKIGLKDQIFIYNEPISVQQQSMKPW
jgi:hypothetical protein